MFPKPQPCSLDIRPRPGLYSEERYYKEEAWEREGRNQEWKLSSFFSRGKILLLCFVFFVCLIFPPVHPVDIFWEAIWWRYIKEAFSLPADFCKTYHFSTCSANSNSPLLMYARPFLWRQPLAMLTWKGRKQVSLIFFFQRSGSMCIWWSKSSSQNKRKHLLPPTKNQVLYSMLSIFTQYLLFCFVYNLSIKMFRDVNVDLIKCLLVIFNLLL